MFKFLNKKKGFTLIELLVVIAIIGILAAFLVVNFGGARQRARDVQRKSDFNQIKTSLRMYYNDKNLYPLTAGFNFGVSFASGEMVYMKLVPHDPLFDPDDADPVEYSYTSASGTDYCLKAVLENPSDRDIAVSQLRCAASCLNPDSNEYTICPD